MQSSFGPYSHATNTPNRMATLELPYLAPDVIDAEFARIVDELTRRGFLTGGLAAAALLGLAACGSGEAGSTGTPKASTRVVDSVNGKITVPADPKRVVSVHVSSDATLFDLGMSPLGVANPGANYVSPRYRSKWKDAAKVFSGGEMHLEDVAALHPDLILGVDWPFITKHYADLTKVAPTVIVPSTTWQATAHGVAEAVGRLADLDKLKDKLRTRSAAIKANYADELSRYRWDILQGGFDPGKYWLYGAKAELGPILADAGVQFASGTMQTPPTDSRAVSYEKIGLLSDADVIGYYANFDGTPNNEGPKLFAQTLWKRLPAVKAGRLVPFPDFLPSGYGDALAVLDELEAGLNKIGTA